MTYFRNSDIWAHGVYSGLATNCSECERVVLFLFFLLGGYSSSRELFLSLGLKRWISDFETVQVIWAHRLLSQGLPALLFLQFLEHLAFFLFSFCPFLRSLSLLLYHRHLERLLVELFVNLKHQYIRLQRPLISVQKTNTLLFIPLCDRPSSRTVSACRRRLNSVNLTALGLI